MANWLQSITSKLTGLLGSKPPSVHVGVFGKHPGWNDHIDDLGLDSEPLVAAKQYLYINGIGGVIDSGRWEPSDADPLISFNHLFLWRDESSMIFGKMWASSDGKGRTKYPMVVCIHLQGRSQPGIPDARPLLDALETTFKATTEAGPVIQSVGSARISAAGLLQAPPTSVPPRTDFARSLGLDPQSQAASRIAYAGASYLAPLKGVPASEIDLKLGSAKYQAQHLRLPSNTKWPLESILFWKEFLKPSIPAGVPQLYLASLEGEWLDVIAGAPTPKNLYCIRAGRKANPIASEIPFEIPPADLEAAGKQWSAFLGAP